MQQDDCSIDFGAELEFVQDATTITITTQ